MSGWDARQGRLEALAAQGLSAAQIAAALGEGVSRNAVIGRARRTGTPLLGGAEAHDAASRGPRKARARTRINLAFRVAAVASVLLGEELAAAAGRLKVGAKALARWRRDPAVLAPAQALAGRVVAGRAGRLPPAPPKPAPVVVGRAAGRVVRTVEGPLDAFWRGKIERAAAIPIFLGPGQKLEART